MKRLIALILLGSLTQGDLNADTSSTPSEVGPYSRSPNSNPGNRFRGGNLFESGATDSGPVYPNSKRSHPPATYLNPDTGVPAYLNYSGTVNTLVGSMGSAAGLAAAVGANLSGSGFAGAGQAVSMAQQQAGNTIQATNNLLQQFQLDPTGQSIRYPAFANTLSRTSTGDLSDPANRPPMDAMMAANRAGGYNVLQGQAGALANVPSGMNSALQAYKLSDNPSHLAHSEFVAGREFVGLGNRFFGMTESNQFDANVAVNAWFQERLSDFIFNENHENEMPGGVSLNAVSTILSGPPAEIWTHKRGWWALFGDVLYGMGDDIGLNAGSVTALANRASQNFHFRDIAPEPGPVAIMDGFMADSVRAIATVLNAKCKKFQDQDENRNPHTIENEAGVKEALDFLKTKDFAFKKDDGDIIWKSMRKNIGGGNQGTCQSLSELISNPMTLLAKVRSPNSFQLADWEVTMYFYAEQNTNFKFDMSVSYAIESINTTMTNSAQQFFREEALRLINKTKRYYYEQRDSFRRTLQGLQARWAQETGAGGVGRSFQRDDSSGDLGQFGGM